MATGTAGHLDCLVSQAGAAPRLHRTLPKVSERTFPRVLKALQATRQPNWPTTFRAFIDRFPSACFNSKIPHLIVWTDAQRPGTLRSASIFCQNGERAGSIDGSLTTGPSGNYGRHKKCTRDWCMKENRSNNPAGAETPALVPPIGNLHPLAPAPAHIPPPISQFCISSDNLRFLVEFPSTAGPVICKQLDLTSLSARFTHQTPEFEAFVDIQPLIVGDLASATRLMLGIRRNYLSPLDWIVSAKVAYVLNDGRVPLIGGWPGDGGSLLPLTVEARGVCNGTAVYADLPFPAMSINTILVVFAVQPLLPELGSREGAYEDGATSDGDANGSDSFSGGSSDTLSRGSLPSGNSNSSLSTLFSGGNHWSNSLADDVSFSYSSTNTTVPDASEPEPVWADAGRAVVDRGDFRDNVSETDSDDGDYQDAEDQAEWDATVDEEPHEAVPAISSFNEVLAEPLMPPSPDDAKARTWGSLSLSEMIGKFGGWLLGKQGETQQAPVDKLERGIPTLTLGGPSSVAPPRGPNSVFPFVPRTHGLVSDVFTNSGAEEIVEELWGERRCHGLFGWRRSDGSDVLTFSRPVKTAELIVWQDGDKAIFGINSGARIEGIFGCNVRVWSYVGAGNNCRFCVRATLK